MSKYGSQKKTVDGIAFDSIREANRYCELKFLEKAGEIKDLERQVKYILIPVQREPDKVGKRGGLIKGKVLERECSYFADFRYYDNRLQRVIVEDTKGFATKDYKIKKKLMLYVHGIQIVEV